MGNPLHLTPLKTSWIDSCIYLEFYTSYNRNLSTIPTDISTQCLFLSHALTLHVNMIALCWFTAQKCIILNNRSAVEVNWLFSSLKLNPHCKEIANSVIKIT